MRCITLVGLALSFKSAAAAVPLFPRNGNRRSRNLKRGKITSSGVNVIAVLQFSVIRMLMIKLYVSFGNNLDAYKFNNPSNHVS